MPIVVSSAARNLASEFGYINYTAHLAGAALGLILGITVFRRKRHWAQALLFEEEDLTQEQGFFRKLNAYLAAPGVAGFAVLAYLFAIILIVRFVTVHWLQVLMIAPIAAALWQLYRMKKADRPDWQRCQEALAALDQSRGREAAQALQELADRGYVRAQYTLAGLYATGRGVSTCPIVISSAARNLRHTPVISSEVDCHFERSEKS